MTSKILYGGRRGYLDSADKLDIDNSTDENSSSYETVFSSYDHSEPESETESVKSISFKPSSYYEDLFSSDDDNDTNNDNSNDDDDDDDGDSSPDCPHPSHEHSLFTTALSVYDQYAMKDCRNFQEDIKGYPCTRPSGFPHILDLRRYRFLDHIDPKHNQHSLIDVVATCLWFNGLDILNSFTTDFRSGFEYCQSLEGSYNFVISREANKCEVTISCETEGDDTGSWFLEYEIGFDGAWKPASADLPTTEVLKTRADLELEGISLGRVLMRRVILDEAETVVKCLRIRDDPNNTLVPKVEDREGEAAASVVGTNLFAGCQHLTSVNEDLMS